LKGKYALGNMPQRKQEGIKKILRGRLREGSCEVEYKLRELLRGEKDEATSLFDPKRLFFTGKRIGKRIIE
jgi:hypothetical protein